jgi:hypothetical protein
MARIAVRRSGYGRAGRRLTSEPVATTGSGNILIVRHCLLRGASNDAVGDKKHMGNKTYGNKGVSDVWE